MQISPAFEIRDYPEIRPSYLTENESEPMALIFLKASTRKESLQTELLVRTRTGPEINFDHSGFDGVNV